jgi:tetratricopeptide (TPR) repeat protein
MKQFLLSLLFVFLFSTYASSLDLMQQADSLFELRGTTFNPSTLIADSAMINQAITLYQKAVNSETISQKEEVTWKLIRAYYFKGKHTTNNSNLKKRIFDIGKNVSEQGLKDFPKSAGINLYGSIVWGVWGEEYGILKAAKEGVAGKIKDRCEQVIAIDPQFDDAGGYRVLGRVYFKAPRIPLILGWPSNKKAVEILEKGVALAPSNLTGKQFLAEALYSQGQKERAIQIMNEVLAEKNIIDGIVEDAAVKNEVKGILAEWSK